MEPDQPEQVNQIHTRQVLSNTGSLRRFYCLGAHDSEQSFIVQEEGR